MLSGMSNEKVARIAGCSAGAVFQYKKRYVKPVIQNTVLVGPTCDQSVTQSTENQPVTPELVVQTQMAVRNATEAVKASPVRERAEWLWSKASRNLERAEQAVRVIEQEIAEQGPDGETVKRKVLVPVGDDLRVIAPIMAQAHRNLEITGQLTGELGSGGTQNNTQVNLYMGLPRAVSEE